MRIEEVTRTRPLLIFYFTAHEMVWQVCPCQMCSQRPLVKKKKKCKRISVESSLIPYVPPTTQLVKGLSLTEHEVVEVVVVMLVVVVVVVAVVVVVVVVVRTPAESIFGTRY